MIKRFRVGKYLAPCYFANNTPGSTTSLTANFTVDLKGAPGATVYLQVTTYIASPGTPFLKVDGTTYVLNDTFTKTLDGTGTYNLAIQIGFSSGGGAQSINIFLAIDNVSPGKIGSPATQGETYTTS